MAKASHTTTYRDEAHEKMYRKAKRANSMLKGRYEGYRPGYAPLITTDDLTIRYGHKGDSLDADMFNIVQDVVKACDLVFIGAQKTDWMDVEGYGTRGHVYDLKFTDPEP